MRVLPKLTKQSHTTTRFQRLERDAWLLRTTTQPLPQDEQNPKPLVYEKPRHLPSDFSVLGAEQAHLKPQQANTVLCTILQQLAHVWSPFQDMVNKDLNISN